MCNWESFALYGCVSAPDMDAVVGLLPLLPRQVRGDT